MLETKKSKSIFGLIGWALFSWNIGLDALFYRKKDAKFAIGKAIVFLLLIATWFAAIAFSSPVSDAVAGDGGFRRYTLTPDVWSVFFTFVYIEMAILALMVLVDLGRVYAFITEKENLKIFGFLKRSNFVSSASTGSDDKKLAKALVGELGGLDNLENIDACITKLRITVKDSSKVMKERSIYQNKYQALGFIGSGKGIQIAYGARAEILKGIMLDFKRSPSEMTTIGAWDESSTNNKVSVSSTTSSTVKVMFTKPLAGAVKPITQSTDTLFAQKAMGDGVLIIPTGNKVVAPFDGEVISTFPTGHAFGLQSQDGTQVLIHIGIDSYKDASVFKAKVKQGDKVTEGQIIVEFDLAKLKKSAKSIETPFIIMNETMGDRKITISKTGKTVMTLN